MAKRAAAHLEVGSRLVFDASFPIHAILADRDDVARHVLAKSDAVLLITDVAAEEVRQRVGRVPDWLQTLAMDDFAALVRWGERVGLRGRHNAGEAATLAIAEQLNCVAIVDDADARRVGRSYWPATHGSLWLMAALINRELVDLRSASSFVDALALGGMRFPFAMSGFEKWARGNGLLEGDM